MDAFGSHALKAPKTSRAHEDVEVLATARRGIERLNHKRRWDGDGRGAIAADLRRVFRQAIDQLVALAATHGHIAVDAAGVCIMANHRVVQTGVAVIQGSLRHFVGKQHEARAQEIDSRAWFGALASILPWRAVATSRRGHDAGLATGNEELIDQLVGWVERIADGRWSGIDGGVDGSVGLDGAAGARSAARGGCPSRAAAAATCGTAPCETTIRRTAACKPAAACGATIRGTATCETAAGRAATSA
jgi:hypothetical protein